jgi:hypothetical protein
MAITGIVTGGLAVAGFVLSFVLLAATGTWDA